MAEPAGVPAFDRYPGSGARAGPSLVLLHGQPGVAADWQWVLPHFHGQREVIVPDRPGYGRTGGRAGGFSANAEAVIRLLDHTGTGSAVIVGHSWGGGVALSLACDHPERVSGLVLVSSVSPVTPLGWEDRLLAAPLVGEALAAGTMAGIGLVLRGRRLLDIADRHLPGRAEDALIAAGRLMRGRAPVWRSFLAEQRAMLAELPALAGRIGRISAPTVVVHGEADHVVDLRSAEDLAAAIPRARLLVVPSAGHLVPHDRPAVVAEAALSL